MASILNGLNAAQRAAVTSSASVLQVLAPPGSGKTKTLTSRVAYLIDHCKYNPRNVICCTFTIKAAREMRERLRGLVGCNVESNLVLGTFHSICRRYLVRYGHLIGLPRNFGIADQSDSMSILKRLAKTHKLGIDPKAARSRISSRKARGLKIEDLSKISQKNVENQDFVTIYSEYEASLAASNLLDYDDLLLRCIDLLNAFPDCVRNVEALLIDEFQDTNVVQFELMKLFASANQRVTVVGDPDQSIYGFRSAEIENLRKMRTFYPDTVVINLEENYRSSSAVLKLAQDVIEQDADRPDKKLKATHCYGTLPVLRNLPNPHEEALWIVAEIKRMMAMTGGLLQYSDFAILLRSAFLSLLVEKALGNAAIPYRMVGGHRFFDRVEVRLVIDYLRTISSPDNNSSLIAIINVPSRKIGETTIKELLRVAEQKKESLWSIIQKICSGCLSLEKKMTKLAEQNMRRFVALINDARKKMLTMKPEDTPKLLIEHVVSAIALQDYLKVKYDEDYKDRWENVQELLTQAMDTVELHRLAFEEALPEIEGLEQREVQNSTEVLCRFLSNIVLSTEVETPEEERNKPRLTISTIHSAKGLEWPVVFIPAIYEGSIPHSRADDTDEERRLLYVAMTRAQALLSLTFPRMQSRDMGESILSQFLPPNVHPRFSQTGPSFTDSVIEDIASVLRRERPTQEHVVESMTKLTDKDSMLDDIWPADGSHRQPQQWLEGTLAGPFPNQQKSLFNAVGGIHNPPKLNLQPVSSVVGKCYRLTSTVSSTTMSNFSTFTMPSMNTGFTTANHQLRVNAEIVHPEVRAQPSRFPSDTTANPTQKPAVKGKKLDPSQGSLSSFFSNGSFKSPPANLLQSGGRTLSNWQPPSIPDPPLPEIRTAPIPTDLASHRLSKQAPSLKRISTVLEDVSNPNKKQYVFLSSSPPPPERGDKPSNPVVINETSTKSSKQLQSTHNVSRQTISLTKPATTMHVTSMSMLQNRGGGLKKTLGVRRTMTGWDARKNK